MISAMGGGRDMPSMDAMRQMQQKMFGKADANGSGGLDAAEFESMVKSSPMAGKGPQAANTEALFKKIDGDGNGELSQAEMEDAHRQMMERLQSTMQAFGLSGAKDDEQRVGSGRAISSTDDLVAQLRNLIDKVSTTYSSSGFDPTRRLMATA
jgi:EF hand